VLRQNAKSGEIEKPAGIKKETGGTIVGRQNGEKWEGWGDGRKKWKTSLHKLGVRSTVVFHAGQTNVARGKGRKGTRGGVKDSFHKKPPW